MDITCEEKCSFATLIEEMEYYETVENVLVLIVLRPLPCALVFAAIVTSHPTRVILSVGLGLCRPHTNLAKT